MSKIDLNSVSQETCLADGPCQSTESSERNRWADSALLAASRLVSLPTKSTLFRRPNDRRETRPNQSFSKPITPMAICGCGWSLVGRSCTRGSTLAARHRETALDGDLRGTSRCIAAVLTSFLKMRSLLPFRAMAGVGFSRLRCERGAMAPGADNNPDLLDGIYDATLNRLGNGRGEPSWWRRVVFKAEGDYVLPYQKLDPHILRIESVREWLSDYQVRADLKALATERILVYGTDAGVFRARLAQSYARCTLDDPALAQVHIESVLSGLVAGALSSLGPSERMLVSLIQQSNRQINQTNFEILGAISRIESTISKQSALTKQPDPFDPPKHLEAREGVKDFSTELLI
jgi:hypothetical protein